MRAELLADRYGIETPTVVMNVPPRGASVDARTRRAELGLAPDRPVALYLGGVVPQRPLDDLVRSARHLDGCLLVILGPGDAGYRERLQRLASELGVAERVVFPPPVPPEQVVATAAVADVGLIPFKNSGLNNYYGLPNKIFEYVVAGVPVAASAFPEMSRLIEQHDIGVTFNPDDPTDIARAVAEVITDPERQAELRRNVRRAQRTLNWEVEHTKLLDLASRLLEGTRPR